VVHARRRAAAAPAKIELSERTDGDVHVPYLMELNGEPKDLHTKITRAQLEQLVGLLIDRTMDVAGRVLGVKGFTPADIQEVLLVGGQTRMPVIWKRIQDRLGREPHKGVHPDEAVALGAALLSAAHDRIDSVVLIDVLPIAIGVAEKGGGMAKVIPRNSTVPAHGTYSTLSTAPDQEVLEVAVFQGDSDRVANCEYLGTVKVLGLRGPPGQRVQMAFTLGEECVLTVAAKDATTGKALETSFALTDTPRTLKAKFEIPEEMSDRLPKLQATPEAKAAGAEEKPAEGEKKEEAGEKPGFLKRLFGIR
jgi:molecular chaperone DnaK